MNIDIMNQIFEKIKFIDKKQPELLQIYNQQLEGSVVTLQLLEEKAKEAQ